MNKKKILFKVNYLLLLGVLLFGSCVSSNTKSESIQSRIIKKFLQFSDFKSSTLKLMQTENRFVDSSSEQPNPGQDLEHKFKIDEYTIEKHTVYHIAPPDNSQENLVVLYLHGGAYMADFQAIHWDLMEIMIEMTGCTVIAPDYPLAPESSWKDAFNMLEKLTDELYQKTSSDNIVFMGDSAGAGLALAFAIHLKKENLPLPREIILLSPWLDISMQNPEIPSADMDDPFLSVEALKMAGRLWAGNIPVESWQVSPLYGDLGGLPEISIFTGTADVLNPDSQLFRDNMLNDGNTINYREYPDMIHDFMFFSMPESEVCMNEIIYLLLH